MLSRNEYDEIIGLIIIHDIELTKAERVACENCVKAYFWNDPALASPHDISVCRNVIAWDKAVSDRLPKVGLVLR